jgi:splicing factor 3A subunit 3
MRGAAIFDNFYTTLQATLEYHQKFPDVTPDTGLDLNMDIDIHFSGEEIFGKYLDLHDHYLVFCNLPKVHTEASKRDLDYIAYLDRFNSFFFIPESAKSTRGYADYVNNLWGYLSDFFHRIQPLFNMDEIIAEWEKKFESKWSAGEVQGWKRGSSVDSSVNDQRLNLATFKSAAELEALGMDRLKAALQAEGLKCGGTLTDRAQRLWSIRGKKIEEIPAKLRAQTGGAAAGGEEQTLGDQRRRLAWTEFQIQTICEAMLDVVTATRRHAEKQQTRTLEEKEAEIFEEEFGTVGLAADDEDDAVAGGDDDGPIYNPLNLPLGWDGKPIPYWLYKLHGLGVEYKCEICGNQSYWGRRAFDKHFQEWRHAHGMRCLGIPNTKHFHDITLIEDAIALHNKIRGAMTVDKPSVELEEFEDSEGNVLNRRTYEDLARQGLL